MSIWDRIARVARAELNEMKRVLSDRDEPAGSPEEARQRAIAEAEAELARAERNVDIARQEMGTHGWEAKRPDVGGARQGTELDRGASLWGSSPASRDQPATVDGPLAPSRARDATPSAPVASREIPTEIRDAYAALELPLGAEAEAIHASHAALTTRFHEDRFGSDPDRIRIATLVRSRIDAARQVTLGWLETRRH